MAIFLVARFHRYSKQLLGCSHVMPLRRAPVISETWLAGRLVFVLSLLVFVLLGGTVVETVARRFCDLGNINIRFRNFTKIYSWKSSRRKIWVVRNGVHLAYAFWAVKFGLSIVILFWGLDFPA